MKILSLDTSSESIVLGYINEKEEIHVDFNLTLNDRHSSVLIRIIDCFLNSIDVNLEEIDFFGCGMGPGFFTALRVGIATVKSFAFAFKKKIVGVPSLDIVAMNFPFDGKVIVIVYARKDHFYVSVYEKKRDVLKTILPCSFYRKENLLGLLKNKERYDEIFATGSGIPYLVDEIKRFKNVKILDKSAWYINGEKLNRLVLRNIKEGISIYDAIDFLPIYVQKPFALMRDEG